MYKITPFWNKSIKLNEQFSIPVRWVLLAKKNLERKLAGNIFFVARQNFNKDSISRCNSLKQEHSKTTNDQC